jgi:hypothetical protein
MTNNKNAINRITVGNKQYGGSDKIDLKIREIEKFISE